MQFNAIVSGLLFLVLSLAMLKVSIAYLNRQSATRVVEWNYQWMINGQTLTLLACVIALALTQIIASLFQSYSASMSIGILCVLCLLHIRMFAKQKLSKDNYLSIILVAYYAIVMAVCLIFSIRNVTSNAVMTWLLFTSVSILIVVTWIFMNRFIYLHGNKVGRS